MSDTKQKRTLSDDDVVVKRTETGRAIERVGGNLGPGAKTATDPDAGGGGGRGASRPGGATDADVS
ncbi:hypothetical protein [Sandaracinus amylolyticus]|uniref:hypothetical protein n=1 Tax=Sandaracinus amylolyticus TaxID=927083 RepID=UPI001F3A3625|nr:hypothetical protein [Sandaracinus amylolyticus]UJR85266.1 Hypothetical protein I5071_73460 [Sandaracinus amylolyticus]